MWWNRAAVYNIQAAPHAACAVSAASAAAQSIRQRLAESPSTLESYLLLRCRSTSWSGLPPSRTPEADTQPHPSDRRFSYWHGNCLSDIYFPRSPAGFHLVCYQSSYQSVEVSPRTLQITQDEDSLPARPWHQRRHLQEPNRYVPEMPILGVPNLRRDL